MAEAPPGGQDAHAAEKAMSTLVLELRAGDMMILNGAAIRFRTKAKIELAAKARFLFGRQIMAAAEADTPSRRIYFALQTAYIGTGPEREAGLADARRLAAAFQHATTSSTARALLDRALILAEQDDCYAALKLVRRIMRHEDAVLQFAAQANSESSVPPAAEEPPSSKESTPVGSDPGPALC
jgi:flagellar biosynthesis repressor protein FlbT